MDGLGRNERLVRAFAAEARPLAGPSAGVDWRIMVLVPAAVVMNRISRLVDVGVELQEALGVGRVSSLEDLQRAFSKYAAWSDDIALALSRSFGGSSTTVEYEAMPQPAISVDDQSRTEVIQLLRAAIDARLRWLDALNERIKQ